MADLTPTSLWNNVFKLETTTQVLGGSDTAPANDPHHDLACRTEYLKDLQKHSVRYLNHSFTTSTTSSNPAKKLFTISSLLADLANIKFVLYFKQGTKRAFLECQYSVDSASPSGVFALRLHSNNFSYSNEFADVIYVMAQVVSDTVEFWIECVNSGDIECAILSIFNETSSFGGWSIDNGFDNITFASDTVTSSRINTIYSATTLKFVSAIAGGSPFKNQVELMAKGFAGHPIDGYNNLIERYQESIPDYLPIGSVIMWYGNVADVPKKWQICDGTNGTPDLRDKFIKGSANDGSVGSTGGSDTNTASFTTNNDGSHQHSGVTGNNNQTTAYTSRYDNSTGNPATSTHDHSFITNYDGSHQHNGTTDSFSIVPSFVSLYFIMKITA